MSSSAFTPTTTQVTTEVPVNVPVVTAWQSYSPNIYEGANLKNSDFTSRNARYRRVGDSVEIQAMFLGNSNARSGTGQFIVSIPSGLTVDTSKLSDSSRSINGYISTGVGSPLDGTISLAIANGQIGAIDKAVGAISYNNTTLNPTNSEFSLYASIPISEWSSGVTTLADRALEEYAASTSGTWDANATAAQTIYGPEGAPITGTITAGLRNKVVRFQSPILPTDKIFLEIYNFNGNPGWVSHTDVGFGIVQQLAQIYGAQINPVNAGFNTDCIVYFYQYTQPAGNSYGGAGQQWTNGLRWRLRKVSSGAQVGYPISTKNIVGATDGVAPVTGMLGQIVQETTSANGGTNTVANVTNTNVRVLSLPAGTWDVVGYASINNLPTTPVRQILTLTTSSATNGTQTIDRFDYMYPASLTGSFGTSTPQVRLNLATTTTIYLVMYSQGASGSVTVDGAQIRAIRIA